jgi:hypothetical protein
MNILLIDGLNNNSAINNLNGKFDISEKFILIANIIKKNHINTDYIDLANDQCEISSFTHKKDYSIVIIHANINNYNLVDNISKKIGIPLIIAINFDNDIFQLFTNENIKYIYFDNNFETSVRKLFILLNIKSKCEMPKYTDYSFISDISKRNISISLINILTNNIKSIYSIEHEIRCLLEYGVKCFHITDLLNFDYSKIKAICSIINELKKEFDFFYSCEINVLLNLDYELNKVLNLLYNSGVRKIIIPVIDLKNKDLIIEYVCKVITNNIVYLQIEINESKHLINDGYLYHNFIMDLIHCTNGLINITFKKSTFNTLYKSILNFNDLKNNIDISNWIININKEIQKEQIMFYNKISLKDRHQIVLLSKYGIISQLYTSIIHKSNSRAYLSNKYIYFSYQIGENIAIYTPILASKIYFDESNKTHVFTDIGFYQDKNELIYEDEYQMLFHYLVRKMTINEIFNKLNSDQHELFTNLLKELEYNNCLYFVKYIF